MNPIRSIANWLAERKERRKAKKLEAAARALAEFDTNSIEQRRDMDSLCSRCGRPMKEDRRPSLGATRYGYICCACDRHLGV